MLCSDARRTVETADATLAPLTEPPKVEYLPELYEGDVDDVLDQLRVVDDHTPSVMVVGHNPTTQVLSTAILKKSDRRGRATLDHSFPTCGLAVYRLSTRWGDLDAGSAKLVGFVAPPY